MCNIERMHVARKPLPLPPPMDKAWMNVDKVIDVFHFGNHVSPQCKERFSPAKLKEENPDFNTQAGDQNICLGFKISTHSLLHAKKSSLILFAPYGTEKKHIHC